MVYNVQRVRVCDGIDDLAYNRKMVVSAVHVKYTGNGEVDSTRFTEVADQELIGYFKCSMEIQGDEVVCFTAERVVTVDGTAAGIDDLIDSYAFRIDVFENLGCGMECTFNILRRFTEVIKTACGLKMVENKVAWFVFADIKNMDVAKEVSQRYDKGVFYCLCKFVRQVALFSNDYRFQCISALDFQPVDFGHRVCDNRFKELCIVIFQNKKLHIG